MTYITGLQAQKIIGITTRQGLNKFVKRHSVEVKSQGAGKPNLYNKTQIKKAIEPKKPPVKKTTNTKPKKPPKKVIKKKPTEKHEYEKKPKSKNNEKDEYDLQIEEKKKQTLEAQKKAKERLEKEDFNPLDKIGQDEYIRVQDLLIENGTYTEQDRGILLAYAIAYQKYINATVQSADYNDTTMDDFSNLKVHPYFQVADRCFTQMEKAARNLGIGANNRKGLDVKGKKKRGIMDIIND